MHLQITERWMLFVNDYVVTPSGTHWKLWLQWRHLTFSVFFIKCYIVSFITNLFLQMIVDDFNYIHLDLIVVVG